MARQVQNEASEMEAVLYITECCELPQWGPLPLPDRESILMHFEVRKCVW